MKRRATIVLAAATAALGAGAGLGWWRSRAEPEVEVAGSDGLWTMRFAAPDGGTIDLRRYLGQPLLLNFWATWCAPCVTEIPLLDAFAQAESGRWHVLALAIDHAEAVQRFLAGRRHKLDFALAREQGVELSRSLGNRNGGLPYSVVFNASGQSFGQRLGSLDPAQLAQWKAGAAGAKRA